MPLQGIGRGRVPGIFALVAAGDGGFDADDPFAGAAKKLKEHYGIEVPISAVRTKTEDHGELMRENTPLRTEIPSGRECRS